MIISSPEFIDKINKTLSQSIKEEIRPGSKISVAAACFSIYAYQELQDELKNIEELRFIFTSPTFVAERAKKEKREFYIPRLNRERSLYGTEFIERLSKPIDQNILLVLTYEDIARLAVFKTILHETAWKSIEDYNLILNGIDFDSMWENVIRSVVGIESRDETSLEEQISLNIEKSKIQKQIDTLKKKMKNEKQFNRQIDIKAEIKKLEKSL